MSPQRFRFARAFSTHRRRALAAVLALSFGLQPALLQAQQAAVHVPSIEALGLSFERIRRELNERPPSTAKSPLNLTYYVEVMGLAPRITLFTPAELAPGGTVPYGPPMHADIVNQLTPEQFKSPRADFGSLALMGLVKLIQWDAARDRREQLDRERRQHNDEERRRQQQLQDSSLIVVKQQQ